MINYRVSGGGVMVFLWMSLFAFGIVAVDQFTKFVVLENIALYEKVPFYPVSSALPMRRIPAAPGRCFPA